MCIFSFLCIGQSSEKYANVHPRDLESDLEGHWASAFDSHSKMLIFVYNIDI